MLFIDRLRALRSYAGLLGILVLAPLFVFPQPGVTPYLMVVVPLLVLWQWRSHRGTALPAALHVALLLLLLMMAVSAWATFNLRLSFPKISGLFYGIALFYALAAGLRSRQAIGVAVAALLLAGVGIALLGLLGTRWTSGKLPLVDLFLAEVPGALPLLVRGIPRAEQGFNPNQVGGTLTLFAPLTASLLLVRLPRRRVGWRLYLLRLGLLGVLLLIVLTLLLTQSRFALFSVTLALFLMALVQGGWARRIALGLFLLLLVTGLAFGFIPVLELLFGLPDPSNLDDYSTWLGRMEIWKRSLRVLRDHPFTGIGFDTLVPIVHARYPVFYLSPERDFVHAHNLYIQSALDLGVVGLFALLWLVGSCLRMLGRVARTNPLAARGALARGLLFGLVAYLIYGLADAIALGQKPGLLLWAFLGVSVALGSSALWQTEGA